MKRNVYETVRLCLSLPLTQSHEPHLGHIEARDLAHIAAVHGLIARQRRRPDLPRRRLPRTLAGPFEVVVHALHAERAAHHVEIGRVDKDLRVGAG